MYSVVYENDKQDTMPQTQGLQYRTRSLSYHRDANCTAW